MADYSTAVTSPLVHAERISRNLGMFVGRMNMANYHQTLVEITGITRHFVDIGHTGTGAEYPKGVLSCLPNGPSDNGHLFMWDATSGAWKCYEPTGITFSGSSTGVAITWDSGIPAFQAVSKTGTYVEAAKEAASDTDCGEITFVAIGLIR